MYSSRQQNRESPEVLKLREECGTWLKYLREAAGLSQREMAEQLGFEYYSFVSQIETGRGRLPTHQLKDWARILRIPVREFARNLLRYYDPINYEVLFGDEEGIESPSAPQGLAPEATSPDKMIAARTTGKPSENVVELNSRIELLEKKALERRVARLEELLKSEGSL
jgi:transcriptional regulator with XRE-family HTH domain